MRPLRWLAGLLALAVVVGVLSLVLFFVRSQKEMRLLERRETAMVDEAISAAAAYLSSQSNPLNHWGTFVRFVGKGYRHPGWNINAPHLIARRNAQFSGGATLVDIYVWLPSRAGVSNPWQVERVEPSQGPGKPLRIFVGVKGQRSSKPGAKQIRPSGVQVESVDGDHQGD